MHEVMKITGESFKEAAGQMKYGKGDVSGGYSSDAILNGPDVLFDQLAAVSQKLVCIWNCVTITASLCFSATFKKLIEESC